MKTIFKIRSTDHSKTMLTKNLSAATVIEIVKNSYGVNYFSAIPTAGGRYACPDGGGSSRSSGGLTTIERSITCYKAPMYNPITRTFSTKLWKLQFSIATDESYFHFVEVESEDHDTGTTEELKRAWLDKSDVTIELISVEGREGFESDIESMIANFSRMRRHIRHLSSWNRSGFRPYIWCPCGHGVEKSVENLDSGNKYKSDIFAIEQHLHCSKCNEKGKAKLVPLIRIQDGYYSPTQIGYYTEGKKLHVKVSGAESDNLSDIYEAIGGDGCSEVYLSDGLHISPRGHLRDS